MSTIVAALDTPTTARPVLRTALALGPVFGARVSAVRTDAEPHGSYEVEAGAAGVPLTVALGDPVDHLRRAADDPGTVALVLGTRGAAATPPLRPLAEAVAAATPKPVVLVPPEARPAPTIRRVVVAMEGTARSPRHLQRTVELVEASQLELFVVHVDDVDSIPSFSDHVEYDTEAYADEFLARYCPGAPHARMATRIGRPADEILAACDDLRPDVLAMGWHQSAAPGRGVVVREVIGRTPVPVLLIALSEP